MVVSVVVLFIIVTTISFFIGMCSYIEAMVKDMQAMLEMSDGYTAHRLANERTHEIIFLKEIRFHGQILQ